MAIRYVRAASFSVITVLAILVIAVSFLYWRLASGPVELAFLSRRIEAAMNLRLTGIRTQIGRTVLELDSETRIPTIRLVNIALLDQSGSTIARAPKAGLELDLTGWMSGNISVRSLDIFGAKLSAVRKFDGVVELGIAGGQVLEEDTNIDFSDQPDAPDSQAGKSDFSDANGSDQAEASAGRVLMSYLKDSSATGPLAALQEIRIRGAQVRFEDEANDALWVAPSAELVLKRSSSGLVLQADCTITSTGAPWRTYLTAAYNNATKKVSVEARVEDVIPVDVASKVYALSQFAKIQSPLSGNLKFEINESGLITGGTAELQAGRGGIDLPNYFARPIAIESGTFKLAYDGVTSTITLADSNVFIDGARAAMTGTFEPIRDQDGILSAIAIELESDNTKSATSPPAQNLIEKVSFKGRTAVNEPRLDIDDLIIMNGETGVRLRGIITGGELSTGLQLAGRLRDVDAELLKRLWPPIMTPNTRAWVQQHVIAGRITEGTFQVNFPPDALAQALKERRLAPGSANFSFRMTDVDSRYFKGLSPITKAKGAMTLEDNRFQLTIDEGHADIAGDRIDIVRGSFEARELLQLEAPGAVDFELAGNMKALKAFLEQPDFAALKLDAAEIPPIAGTVSANVKLDFPLIKAVPKERVDFSGTMKISNAAQPGVSPGIDLTDGTFDVAVVKDKLTASGTAKLNGIASKIAWQRGRAAGSTMLAIETTLDAKTQAKLGIDIAEFAKGDVPVKLTASGPLADGAKLEADLSGVALRINALGWSRKPVKGTKLSLNLSQANGTPALKDISVTGPGLTIKGEVALNSNRKLKSVTLSEVQLDEDYRFTARIEPAEKAMRITIKGNALDARPFIKSAISPVRGGEGKAALATTTYDIDAEFDRVLTNRGEIIQNVRARVSTGRSTVQSATVEGSFLSGLPIKLDVIPLSGGREVRVVSTDGGAALRAANFYGKIAGGTLDFRAEMSNAPGSPIKDGLLSIRNFEVRNEAALAELDRRGKPKRSGPRREGISFKRLKLPFSSDDQFMRLDDIELTGNDLGAVAGGRIRKQDGALFVKGTIIPAQGINGLFDDIPLIGTILSGGDGEGIFGITFAMGGTIAQPKWQVNPISAVAPGILRKFFEFQIPKNQRQNQDRQAREDVTGSTTSPY